MNPTELAMLHLLDCAIREKHADPALFEAIDWEAMFMLAQQHKIDGLLLDTICALPSEKQPEENVLAAWQSSAMLTVMAQTLLVEQLFLLLSAFESQGLRAVVLKGVALKPLYPDPDMRTMSDADVLVAQESFAAACQVMESAGYTLQATEPFVSIYKGADGLLVELHEKLFDQTAYGFLSRLDESSMFPIADARREAVYGGEAWVLPPAQHAMFMLCHMAKHMITTGFGLRQTTDFMLFIEANDKNIEWDAFWQQAALLGLSGFAEALLTLSTQYFSLPKGEWAQGVSFDAAAAEALALDLLDAGVFGNRTEERRRSAAVVYRSFEVEDGDSGKIRRALFPSAVTLKAPYLYARKYRFLLPAAWVHRFFNYGLSVLTGKAKYDETAKGMQIADERLLLLGRLGLRDDSIEGGKSHGETER